MTDDRPDYTGSIVIEDIELVSATVTVTGAVTVSGNITILNSTIAVTQSGDWHIESITGSVTITGAVTITSGNVAVTGSVTILNASIAVTGSVTVSGAVTITSGSVTVSGAVTITSGSVTVSGAVTITSGSVTVSGSVTITSGTVTATISGTPNINISSQSINLVMEVAIGYVRQIEEKDNQEGTGGVHGSVACGVSVTLNTDTATTTAESVVPTDYEIIAFMRCSSAYTYKIFRDGTELTSGTLTAEGLTIVTYLDTNVAAGSHSYSLQFGTTATYAANLYAIDELNNISTGSISGVVNLYIVPGTVYTGAAPCTTTLVKTGSVQCIVSYANLSGSSRTISLKRGTTTLKQWTVGGAAYSVNVYQDADLAAGAYTYTVDVDASGSGNIGLATVQDAAAEKEIYLTPYWRNLNIGLDTRASESGGNLDTIAGQLDSKTSVLARLQPWYQTNFTPTSLAYRAAAVAPASFTSRWSYTVPTSRIAIIDMMSAACMRDAAPTTAGNAIGLITVRTVNAVVTEDITATVGLQRRTDIAAGAILKAAQVLQAYTYDASTGGTYIWNLQAHYTEFDT